MPQESGFSEVETIPEGSVAHHTLPVHRERLGSDGLTLLELLITLAVIAILSAISLQIYGGALEKSKITRAIVEIESIEAAIIASESDRNLPDSLDEIGWGGRLDPWGNPYRYSKHETNKQGKVNPGKVRKDRFLVPLNSTYDLYSMGPDGDSKLPLTAKASRDDIVRAGDGAFIGPASEF